MALVFSSEAGSLHRAAFLELRDMSLHHRPSYDGWWTTSNRTTSVEVVSRGLMEPTPGVHQQRYGNWNVTSLSAASDHTPMRSATTPTIEANYHPGHSGHTEVTTASETPSVSYFGLQVPLTNNSYWIAQALHSAPQSHCSDSLAEIYSRYSRFSPSCSWGC